MEHIYFDREDGLAHCKVCGGAEGTLTTECRGNMLPYDTREAVYSGLIDFKGGKWVAGAAQKRAAEGKRFQIDFPWHVSVFVSATDARDAEEKARQAHLDVSASENNGEPVAAAFDKSKGVIVEDHGDGKFEVTFGWTITVTVVASDSRDARNYGGWLNIAVSATCAAGLTVESSFDEVSSVFVTEVAA